MTAIQVFKSLLEQKPAFLGGKNITKRGSTLPLPSWALPAWLSALGDTVPGVSSASPLPDIVGKSAAAQDFKKFSLS